MLSFRFIIKFLIGLIVLQLSLLGCEEALLEPKLSDEKITILTPENNSKVFNKAVRFEWLKIQGASRYQIQLASPTFNNPDFVIFDRIVDTIFVIDTLRQIASYEWRVRGLSNNQMTPYTTSRIKLIKNPGFEFQNVNLISPVNNQILNTLKNTLNWEALEDAETYEVQVLNTTSEVFSTKITKENMTELTFPEGESTWQVRGTKDGKNTSFSKNKILVDSKKPETPSLTTPTTGSTIAKADLEFTWTRTAVAGTTEKDSIYIYTDAAQTDLKLKQEVASPFSTDLEIGTYYWKVQAFDQANNKSDESAVFSITLN